MRNCISSTPFPVIDAPLMLQEKLASPVDDEDADDASVLVAILLASFCLAALLLPQDVHATMMKNDVTKNKYFILCIFIEVSDFLFYLKLVDFLLRKYKTNPARIIIAIIIIMIKR